MTTTMTSDRGAVELPDTCPGWCDRAQHLMFAGESDGAYPVVEVTAHQADGGMTFLPELRNGQQIEAQGGG